MQLLASTSKVLQGRALLRPHHDDRKQKHKKHAAVQLIRIAAAGLSASHQPSKKGSGPSSCCSSINQCKSTNKLELRS
jgi:hypothetical protein